MLTSWIDPQLADSLAMAFAHSIWQGLVVILPVAFLLRLDRTRSPRFAYQLCFSGLVTVCVATLATFWWYYVSSPPATGTVPADSSMALPMYTTAGRTTSAPPWQQWVIAGWLLGCVLYSVRLGVGSIGILRIKNRATPINDEVWKARLASLQDMFGIRRRVELLKSHTCRVPFVFGVIRPVIVFPAVYFNRLTAEQFESILLHELVHIKRYDFLYNILQTIIESLLFFNPAVWWLSARIRAYREYCCDDMVQNTMTSRRTYPEALYRIAQFAAPAPAPHIALFQHQSQLTTRIKRMLNDPLDRTTFKPMIASALGILMILTLFAFSLRSGTEYKEVTGDQIRNRYSVQKLSVLPPADIDYEAIFSLAEEQTHLDQVGIPDVQSPGSTALPVQEPDNTLGEATDTIPPSPRMEELEKQMEAKAKEMEALSEEFEIKMEEEFEPGMERIEEMAERIEEMHEERMEEFEEQFQGSGQMMRLEELSEQLEERMEHLSEQLEESLDEEYLEDLEQEMEMKAREIEEQGEMTLEVEEEMRMIQERIEQAMAEFRLRHEQLMQDEVVQQLQEEMRTLRESIRPMMEEYRNVWSKEAKLLQEQMQDMQHQLQEQMQPLQESFRAEMEQKAQEMQQLAREMQDEAKRQSGEQNNQKDNQNN